MANGQWRHCHPLALALKRQAGTKDAQVFVHQRMAQQALA
jgi:hypothetical protein